MQRPFVRYIRALHVQKKNAANTLQEKELCRRAHILPANHTWRGRDWYNECYILGTSAERYGAATKTAATLQTAHVVVSLLVYFRHGGSRLRGGGTEELEIAHLNLV